MTGLAEIVPWAAPVAVTVAIPVVGWVFDRISRARSLETREAIAETVTTAVGDVETRLRGHIDEIRDELKSAVEQISGRESITRDRVARLEGRVEQMTIRGGQ